MKTTPRRRVIRPSLPALVECTQQRKLTARREQLEREQVSLSRWMTRMKRAFHAVEKQQKKVTRLEKEIKQLSSGEMDVHANQVGSTALPVRLLSL